MISGPKQLGNDIDAYLSPLLNDLKMLWDIGIETYDAHRDETLKGYVTMDHQ